MSASFAADTNPRDSWTTMATHLTVVCLIALATWLPRFQGPIDLRFDAGVYYELGAGLARGEGYRILSEPGKPEGLQYPPALPLLVAGHMWLTGTGEAEIVGTALRRTYFAFTLALGVLTWILARRHLPALWATMAGIMVLIHVHGLMLSDVLFAEIPSAICVVVFALLLGPRTRSTADWPREAAVYGVAVTGYLLRTANVALLAVWVAEALLRREWMRGVKRGLLAALPVFAWQAHVWRVEHSPDYLRPAYAYQRASYHYHNVSYPENMKLIDPFTPEAGEVTPGLMVRRLVRNACRMPGLWGGSATVNEGYWYLAIDALLKNVALSLRIAAICATALGVAALVGLGLLARGGHWSLPLLLGTATFPVCLTPWTNQFERYLMPVAPIVVLGLLFALRELILVGERRFGQRRKTVRVAAAAFLSVLGGMQVVSAFSLFASGGQPPARLGAVPTWFYYGPTWLRWEHAVEWIREHSSEETIVATTASHLCHIRTGLLSVMPPMERDAEKLNRLLDSVPISFVVIDEMKFPVTARRYVLPALKAHGSKWKLVYEEGKTQVYQRLAGTAPAGEGSAP